MAEKDMTEKALEAFNDVFADIINNLVFHGQIRVRRMNWNRGGNAPSTSAKKHCGNRSGIPLNTGRIRTSASLTSGWKTKQKRRTTCRFG